MTTHPPIIKARFPLSDYAANVMHYLAGKANRPEPSYWRECAECVLDRFKSGDRAALAASARIYRALPLDALCDFHLNLPAFLSADLDAMADAIQLPRKALAEFIAGEVMAADTAAH
jgi:hypothetical protein